MYEALPDPRPRVLFRLAIEETESWFIADTRAIKQAYPRAKTQKLKPITPDAIVGAWEKLFEALGAKYVDKTGWAMAIAPHLNLDDPPSPSLRELIQGIEREQIHTRSLN
jgi:hypothetical protein